MMPGGLEAAFVDPERFEEVFRQRGFTAKIDFAAGMAEFWRAPLREAPRR